MMHAAGTMLGLVTIIVPIAMGHPWYVLLWPVVAYGFAWSGHFLIEGNKPLHLVILSGRSSATFGCWASC